MDWLTRMRVTAETHRVLQHRYGQAHQRWTARMTARRLGLPPSSVSMAVQVERALEQYPHLRDFPSLRAAYDEVRYITRGTHGTRQLDRIGAR